MDLALLPHSRYRPDVDGLRAVAIVPVVAFHAGWSVFGGGFVGVDVFFVISGFLISVLLLDELQRNGRIDIPKFYARRARRLFPALAIVMLATIVLSFFFLLPFGEQQELAKSSIATSFFASNIFFWMHSGYFDGPSEQKPLLNMWSLSVEEQFYWIWPFLLIGIWGYARRFKVVGAHLRLLVMVVFGIIFAMSLAGSVLLTAKSQTTAFYMMPVRSWEFALGGLIALAPQLPVQCAKPWITSSIGLVGLGMIATAMVTFSRATLFPGFVAIVPAMGTALLIYSGASSGSLTCRLLSMRGFVHIGLLSYSWYLWHWPLMAISRAYNYGRAEFMWDNLLGVGALLLAFLTYRFVENPIRRAKRGLFSSTRGALLGSSGLLALIVLCSIGLGVYAKFVATASGQQKALLAAMDDGVNLTPECSNGDGSSILAGTLPARENCTIGDQGSGTRVLLWGDSFAAQYAPLLDRLGKKDGFAVLQRVWFGCAPLLDILQWHGRVPQRDCADFNPKVVRELGTLRIIGIDTAILAANWLQQFPKESNFDHNGHDVLVKYEAGLRRTLDELDRHGFKVLLIAQTPQLPIDVPRCLARLPTDACGVSRATFEARRADVMRIMRTIVEGRRNVRIFDLAEVLCNPTDCPATIGTAIVYRDRGHLTASMLPLLEPAWASQVQGLLHGEGER